MFVTICSYIFLGNFFVFFKTLKQFFVVIRGTLSGHQHPIINVPIINIYGDLYAVYI